MITSNMMNEYREKIVSYMQVFTKHDYKDCEVGRILDNLYEPTGKMLRGQLVIVCGKIAQKLNSTKVEADDERLYRMAALIELTHYASLIHDDVIDDSPTRRNKVSIQSAYGKNAAVFAGDILLSRIYHQLVVEEVDEISLLMTKLLEEMCVGEIIQDFRRYNLDSGMNDYLMVVEDKTAKLFSSACKVGCICVKANEEVKDIFVEIGKNLGYMFQIRDDYLDYLSNSQLEGKNTGKDLLEGIYTFPLLSILEVPEARTKLNSYLERKTNDELDNQDFLYVKNLIEEFGGFEKTKKYINLLANKCYENIALLKEKMNADSNTCLELEQLKEIVSNVQSI